VADSDDIGDLTGRKIGDYEMMARIGIGGMGVVYEGRHPLIGKRVAVKFLLPALSKDKELVSRFISEARSVNAIGHRGIVDIFNFGVMEDGTQYFVMEFLEGRPFDQVIAKEAPMHPALAMRYLEEILDALQAAHDAGVIHRDIKPSNIFLVESGRTRPYIKILDFGIAKTGAMKSGSTPQTRQSVVIGTPEYIAPEQAQGRAISAATDLYAIGCMAFEMLAAKLPFRGENPLDTMFKHVVEPTPRVRSLVADIPAALDELVWKLMQKRPEDRPSSATEVLVTLEGLRGQATVDVGAIRRPGQAITAPSAPIPLTAPTGDVGPAAFAPTVSTADALKAVRAPSPMRGVIIVGLLVAAAAAVTAYALLRQGPAAPVVVEPLPPVKPVQALAAVDSDAAAQPEVKAPAAGVDAGAPAEVAKPAAPPDAGSPYAIGVKPVITPTKRMHSAKQLMARISILERQLEQREAQRGEAMPTLRALLKQGKDDAARANSESARDEVWQMLDDVGRQIER
jgi:serine/threonine-protein kinase